MHWNEVITGGYHHETFSAPWVGRDMASMAIQYLLPPLTFLSTKWGLHTMCGLQPSWQDFIAHQAYQYLGWDQSGEQQLHVLMGQNVGQWVLASLHGQHLLLGQPNLGDQLYCEHLQHGLFNAHLALALAAIVHELTPRLGPRQCQPCVQVFGQQLVLQQHV